MESPYVVKVLNTKYIKTFKIQQEEKNLVLKKDNYLKRHFSLEDIHTDDK